MAGEDFTAVAAILEEVISAVGMAATAGTAAAMAGAADAAIGDVAMVVVGMAAAGMVAAGTAVRIGMATGHIGHTDGDTPGVIATIAIKGVQELHEFRSAGVQEPSY